MKKTNKPLTAEAIAKLAEKNKNVSCFFTNKGTMMGPVPQSGVTGKP